MRRLLLCTDLDRTLLPNGAQEESKLARKRFKTLAQHPQTTLVYVSGRDQQLISDAIKEYAIPIPDYIIADVGSSIYQTNNHSWQNWDEWDKKIAKDWRYKSTKELFNYITQIDDIKLQEDNKQNKHKLSFYVPLDINHNKLITDIKNIFKSQQIKTNIIWSIDEIKNIGLLDILPASAGKAQAIQFLINKLGFDLNEVVFSGDSGNDICVMASEIPSVLVANAHDDIKEEVIQLAKQNNQQDAIYIAQGNYLGMNGNYSAGILEGVVHYNPEIEKWFNYE